MCMREEAGYKTAAGSLKMFLVERMNKKLRIIKIIKTIKTIRD